MIGQGSFDFDLPDPRPVSMLRAFIEVIGQGAAGPYLIGVRDALEWACGEDPSIRLGGLIAGRSTVVRQAAMSFDGATYDPDRDQLRLSKGMVRVVECLRDGQWWTLGRLAQATGITEAGVSARIRDLRKARYGAHYVDRRHVGDGLHEYRVVNPAALPEIPDADGGIGQC